jgi:predicted DCC family thiol-disulfide oxidoreductase YuxK
VTPAPERAGVPPVPAPPEGRPLVLFDGDCAWCTGWAAWLVRRDRGGRFLLAPLRGETARRYLGPAPPPDTMALVEPVPGGGRVRLRSRAVLGVLRHLGGPWRAVGLLALVPAPLADRAYGWVARRRHALAPGGRACARPPLPPGRVLP